MRDIEIIKKAVRKKHPCDEVHGAIERIESLLLKDADLPPHLKSDASYCVCDGCGRKSWSAAALFSSCGMTQPSGEKCRGHFDLPK